VAFDVRESGRGEPPRNIPGTLKAVKAIGWYIEEYGIAQVSMNLTDLRVTPLHVAFDETCRAAEARGLRVTGSELVGLIPLASMLEAGRHFLRKQQRSIGVSERELIRIAVRSLGLADLTPFDPAQRIIEYRLRAPGDRALANLSLEEFADLTASESVAPGGGSVSAAIGALGVSLGAMVANLSSHKRGWDDRWEEFSRWAERAQSLKDRLLRLVDEDTRAFNKVMQALALPRSTGEEQRVRADALQAANLGALEIPWQVMQVATEGWELIAAMARDGNPASASDAGVGALALRAAIRGAWLNVRTNATGIEDKRAIAGILADGARLEAEAAAREGEILGIVDTKM
jgi:glutamate formiminotransferase/formiminotetrahydrofolate cyclodeaminase